jgi:hypothetical protein
MRASLWAGTRVEASEQKILFDFISFDVLQLLRAMSCVSIEPFAANCGM